MKKAFIYKIQHIESGKSYIGSTNRPRKRWYEHRHALRKGTHHAAYLQNSWNKYGEDSFEFLVVEECPEENKFLREKEWVLQEKTTNPEWGYNMVIPEETGGYVYTKQRRLEKSKKSKEVMASYLERIRKSKERQIVVIDLIIQEREYYDMPQDCPIKFGNEKGRSHFNFAEKKVKIKTYNKSEEQIQQEFDKVQKRYQRFLDSQTGKPKYVKIYKVDKKTLEHVDTFDSMSEAAKHAGTQSQKIRDCVSGLLRSYKGYIYTDDLDNVEPVNYSRKRKICDNGVVYNNWKEYSKATGLTKQQILLKLRSKNHPDIYWIETPNVKKNYYVPNPRQTKPVKDNNGNVYESVTKAASTLGLVPKKIYEVLSGRANTTKGYSFQYV